MKLQTAVRVRLRGDGPAEGATQYTGPDRRTKESGRTAEDRVQAEIVGHLRDALARNLQGGDVMHVVCKRAPEGASDDDEFREAVMHTAVANAAVEIAGEAVKIHFEGEEE